MPSRTDRRDATSLVAAVSNMSVDFIEGVKGDSIPEAAFPPGGSSESIKLVVHQNLTSALIFENDVDWDIRLRPRLDKFSAASRFPTQRFDSDLFEPYGDPANWDILWLGHCGAGFPRTPPTTQSKPSIQNIILTNPHDQTVPLPKYLRAHPFGPLDALATSHAPHTRVYHRANGGALCTVAYAVSQRGARRLLHEFGVKRWIRIWDVEMGDWCAGSDHHDSGKDSSSHRRTSSESESSMKMKRVCVTVQPPIFAHHHPPGGESNIGGVGEGYARTVETMYVRLSMRMNLEILLAGGTEEDLVDQWSD
ncbi:uncharacterized protein RSE6_12306 [Rhynchosporium secalis]|uniref:LPS glycosyltransferase n=1 Tax=Rhynchosporium secalis TaxID=38038 RepID=A0A1E1MQ17_RHYSE|nr:uncharacterized protein RSE6_12306 [Rhynchosporium secalis]